MTWGSRFVATDFFDPATGEPLYGWAKVRPAWYWYAMRVRLFLAIVGRDSWGGRLGIRAAWAVACVVHAPQRMSR